MKKVQAMSTEVGISINTETSNDVLDEFLNNDKPIDFVQFMGIEKIGYQGQEFDGRVIQKIKSTTGEVFWYNYKHRRRSGYGNCYAVN